jgi:hypothetical protein
VTNSKRYIVAQVPDSGAWRHYLWGWIGDDGWVRDEREVPVFYSDRAQALVLDETTARQLAARFDARYRHVVQHVVEEAP